MSWTVYSVEDELLDPHGEVSGLDETARKDHQSRLQKDYTEKMIPDLKNYQYRDKTMTYFKNVRGSFRPVVL